MYAQDYFAATDTGRPGKNYATLLEDLGQKNALKRRVNGLLRGARSVLQLEQKWPLLQEILLSHTHCMRANLL